jgi:hypothetical protein
MSAHEIANRILAWLEGIWNHPIPWGQLFIFAAVIAGWIVGVIIIMIPVLWVWIGALSCPDHRKVRRS